MIKLVCISDSHHKHYYLKLPKGDILIHGGDWTYRGERIERMLVIDYLKHISKQYKHVITIMGNHDIGMTKEWFNSLTYLPENVHVLQDNMENIEGINFHGSPYSVKFGTGWGFGEDEDKLATRFNHISKKTDILITHGPAYSILDKNKYGECCGSKALYQKIKQLPKLKHHIFGHIHERGGQQQVIEGITFSNVSVLDENYEIKNKPTIIKI